MKRITHVVIALFSLCILITGCSGNQDTALENIAPTEDAEKIYSKYLLRNYFIEGGCNKQVTTEGTIRNNTAPVGVSNGWTIRSFNETAENSMDFDVLQLLDISSWGNDGIDKLVFSRLRDIGLEIEPDLAKRNINTLSMLVFLEQTIGETDAFYMLSKQSWMENLDLFPKNKSKIKKLRKLIRSNADVACNVIFEMGVISNIGSLDPSEQKKLDGIDKSLRKIIGNNGKNSVTDIEKWLATTHAEGEMEKIRQEVEADKRALESQEAEEAYQDYLDGAKPHCVEYPSDNPKYVVVKCTNLP